MPTVELVEDPSIRASCSPLKPLQQEVTKAYFAIREDKKAGGASSSETKVIDHTTTKGQTLSKIAAQYNVELKDVKRTKTTKYLQIGEIVKVTTKEETTATDSGTAEAKFTKVTSASVNSDVYIIVETKNLQNEKALINVLQGQEDVLGKKDTALTIQQDDADVVQIEAVVGAFAKEEDISNKDDFKDWAITKVKLAPKDEEKLKEWTDGLECAGTKKASLYLLIDVHSENSIADFKSEYVDYKGYKGSTDDSRVPNYFLNEEGEWLEVQNGGVCGGKGCIKDGDENKLVQELNIRLAGFGGNVPTEKFTERTIDMIKQFQKDYMEIEPTGTVCGNTLEAIDEFESKYPIVFSELKCDCGVCTGFGQGKYATQKQSASIAEKSRKYEYPGIHRSLLWAYKAMMFYASKKEGGKYSINKINSGYRCHENNKQHSRSSTNHMGKAIDIHFNKNGVRTREITDVEAIRDKIIIPTNKAQINWGSKNKFSLEPSRNASFVATSWIHMDVRQFDLEYLKDEFFANTAAKIKGKKIVEVAKDEGFATAVDCQGGGFTSQEGSKSDASETNDCQSKFDKIAPIILEHEGGYVNHAADKGGPTNKGITLGTWTKYAKSDTGVEPTLANLKKITDEQASKIYRKRYWEPKGFCEVENDKVGLMVYDWTITSGGAGKQVQKLLVKEFGAKIATDGAIGKNTIKAINAVSDQAKLLKRIGEIRKQYYTDLTYTNGKKNSQDVFLKGWHNRVDKCLNAKL